VLIEVCGARRLYADPERLPAPREASRGSAIDAPVPTPPSEIPILYRHAIRDAMSRGLRPIQFCYEEELRRRPTLSGRVVIGFTIGTDGAVSGAWAVERTLPRDVAGCMVRAVRRIPFPEPPSEPVTLHYPFSFQAMPVGGD